MTPMRPDKELIKLLNGWPNDPRGADYSVKSIQDLMRQAADRLEALSGGEAVASSAYVEAAEPFFRLAREVINPADYERPWHADSKDWMVVFSFAGQSVTLGDLRRAAVASPIREPEISREALGEAIYLALYEHQGAVWAANESKGVWYDAADRLRAILNLAPVGGRGEETGWLIERQDLAPYPLYMRHTRRGHSWTPDPNEAAHFATKDEASAECCGGDESGPLKVTEHMWQPLPRKSKGG